MFPADGALTCSGLLAGGRASGSIMRPGSWNVSESHALAACGVIGATGLQAKERHMSRPRHIIFGIRRRPS